MDENHQIFYTNLTSFCNPQNVHEPQIDIFYLIRMSMNILCYMGMTLVLKHIC